MLTNTKKSSSVRPLSHHGFRKGGLRRLLLIVAVFCLFALSVRAAEEGTDKAPQREPRELIPSNWDVETGKNIKWRGELGPVPMKSIPPHAARAANTSPCIAGGKVFIGSISTDWKAGTLSCFNEESGELLWQHSNPRIDSIHDQYLGVASTPHVENNRLWYVNNRCEVVCLDTEGFRDGENDGPYRDEAAKDLDNADVVWKFDMIDHLGVFPCRVTACTPAVAGNLLFINTNNGIKENYYTEAELEIPAPESPNFLALDKRTGGIVWTDNSVGANILRGGWASPTYAVLGGVPQVLFPGGDGWLYSFDPRGDGKGKGKLLWKFDCNPKTSKWQTRDRNSRNLFIAPAVTDNDLVYIAVGRELTYSGGYHDGHLWCIDPTKRGDVSPELVFNRKATDASKPIPHKRLQACVPEEGDFVRPNPNSALVWHYQGSDFNGDGKMDWEEKLYRVYAPFAVKNGLLVIADAGGIVHCVDAKTGKPCWSYALPDWSMDPVLIFGDFIYVCHFDVMSVFRLSADPNVAMRNSEPLRKIDVGGGMYGIYGIPVLSKNVLYVPTPGQLLVIAEGAKEKTPGQQPNE